jgi:hypothetical protein
MVTGRLKDRNKMERRLGKIQARHPQVNDLHDLALKMWGYRTLLAYNGKEALEMAEHHRGDIDLLLSDVTMRRWAARNRRRKIGEGLPTSWPQGGKTGQKWENVSLKFHREKVGVPPTLGIYVRQTFRPDIRAGKKCCFRITPAISITVADDP